MDADDLAWLQFAYRRAVRSPDPSTKNGAAVVHNNRLLGMGNNEFPVGIKNSKERWADRSTKYRLVAHAEAMACIRALESHGGKTRGATLYCPWYACVECAKTILLAGIGRIVGHADLQQFAQEHNPAWTETTNFALEMFSEAGVVCEWIRGPVDAPRILMGGVLFNPASSDHLSM